MPKTTTEKLEEYKNVWVFVEIQDHERVLACSLELLTKGRDLANKLGEKLYAIVFGLEVNQYLSEIEEYGPDIIIFSNRNDLTLKHYNSEIFPNLMTDLIKKNKPSIILFPSTEAGRDLAPRLAQRFNTGLTAHCSDLDIMDSEIYGNNLLVMKRPAFSGNMNATILCPYTRPQLATVQQGIFKKEISKTKTIPEIINIVCPYNLSDLKIVNIESPTRWNRVSIPLEKALTIISGGRGMGSKKNFQKLFELADLLNGEVGATRVPVFNEWCSEERMIGQTGKYVKPDVYINFGISGQIQHIYSIMESKRIISINSDPDAPINEISDYIINEDLNAFLPRLIKRLREEKKTFEE